MNQAKVFADFHNADYKGRLRLNCTGTISDLAYQKVLLQEGKNLMFYSEDVEVCGVVEYSTKESIKVEFEFAMQKAQDFINLQLALNPTEK